MFQGTASSVGKTILTAALCRIFKDDGYLVSPFKSQNMTSDSFLTKEGKEIAMSQAIQAEAAGIEARVEMNPILLKPTNDRQSQVIINGDLTGSMSAGLYQAKKGQLKNTIKNSYDSLTSKFNIVVIEGAGSPAEINLSKNDIVNMGLADLVDAPVILIGDIDRGGIFASIYGTFILLEEEERSRIKGFIINKFRGDIEILKPGIRMLEDLVNRPCLGVIPYIDINIEAVHSLAEIRESKGEEIKQNTSSKNCKKTREIEYDKLATIVRENVDIDYIKKIMGINNG